MNRAIVLLSGGLDSSTCLGMAVEKLGKENVIALTASYGQRHSKEIECSKRICEYYGVKRLEIDASEIFKGASCSLLSSSVEDVPEESYEEQLKETAGDPVSTYVPFRNGIFLSITAAAALINNCNQVYYGAHKDDAAGSAYPDCSEDFHMNMKAAIKEGTGGKVEIVAPFIRRTKADIVAEGLRIGVPYELTWSCYKGGDKPCGKCGTCIDRDRAFKANGAEDPLWTR